MHHHKLENIYKISDISKQGHIQYMTRRNASKELEYLVINLILEVRSMHNVMGLKKIHKLLSPEGISRDRFISIGVEYGLGIKIPRSYQRTTYSTKSSCFSNIAAISPITNINQVWVSDITYFRVGEKFYYLTFIEDVYSRRILGYTAYPSLEAEANCIALKMAIKARKGSDLRGLIHHSDKGSQYISNKYLQILTDNKIAVSMCNSVYENTHMERLNGIIKNEYLENITINNYQDLQRELKKVVILYNENRPHWGIECKSPLQFEEELPNISLDKRKELTLYLDKSEHYVQESLFD
jgi:hypothetical protein